MDVARALRDSVQALPGHQQGHRRAQLRCGGHGAQRGGRQARILMLRKHQRAGLRAPSMVCQRS